MPATRPISYAEMAAKPPAALLQASHAYMWRGGTIPPLSPLHVGHYEVLEIADKFFRLAAGGSLVWRGYVAERIVINL
jgi:hypothetical protein